MSQDQSAKRKAPATPRPSSSVLLISPTNQVLLLHRVKESSSFASAHVFPGGNLDEYHDGSVPGNGDPARHQDNEAYRLAAIRETFEESGIILAKNAGFGRLIELSDQERDEGRKAIHGRTVEFTKWLSGKGGRADVDGLVPFTRWVTPTNVPKRFTTQMYIYFLPLSSSGELASEVMQSSGGALIPTPTDDGGIEHTAARFLPPHEWLRLAQAGEIILFPPQYFLLHLISQFLYAKTESESSKLDFYALSTQRTQLKQFVKTGDPPWGDKCISPTQLLRRKSDGRAVLGLDKPGPELKDTVRKGEFEHVVLVEFKKEGPRRVEVVMRKDVLEAEHSEAKEKL